MFRWLFQKEWTRERAIAVAVRFLAGNGYRIVAPECDADFANEHMPVVLEEATRSSKRWYVRFRLLTPPGLWRSQTMILVQLNDQTGEAQFDGLDTTALDA